MGVTGVMPLSVEDVADALSKAARHWGSCAKHLQNTVEHLEKLGIRGRNLRRLQALIAERIQAATAPPKSNVTFPV
jgi:cation transport protein ChaC